MRKIRTFSEFVETSFFGQADSKYPFNVDNVHALAAIVRTMDVPREIRDTVALRSSLQWLKDHLAVKNSNHPKFPEVIDFVEKCLDQYAEDD